MKKIIFVLLFLTGSIAAFAQYSARIVEPTPTEARIGETIPVTIEYSSHKPVKFQVQINKIGWGSTAAWSNNDEKFPAGKNQKAVINLRVKEKDGSQFINHKDDFAYTFRMWSFRDPNKDDKKFLAAEFQKFKVDILKAKKKK